MNANYFIKFCGITRIRDAISAQELGCQALGFVFVKQSKRYIEPFKCQSIIDVLSPKIVTVALFANNTKDEIQEILKSCRVHVLQFHGNESPEFCKQWNRPFWKAIPMADKIDPLDYANQYPEAHGYLIDNYGTQKSGGSGTHFDWTQLPTELSNKWILAGGLNPGNIRSATTQTSIRCFDVSSGIEEAPGIKSKEKMTQFIDKLYNR